MTTRSNRRATVIQCAGLILAFASSLSSQPTAANPAAPVEFPVTMRQTITAGKTPVGTRVEAQLDIATLVNGIVVPRGATLKGEVIQSVAKTKTEPSRLAILVDSAQWKNGSTPLKVYLTAWFYPAVVMPSQDVFFEPADASNGRHTWNGQGAYPDPRNPATQQKFPGRDGGKDSEHGTSATTSTPSKHRTLLKNIDSARSNDGVITLNSSSQNIKIDRLTTYVLASSDLFPLH